MTTADSHIGSNRQHRLSDQVPANTHNTRARRKGARDSGPSAAASTSPPAPGVSGEHLILYGSGLAGLGGPRVRIHLPPAESRQRTELGELRAREGLTASTRYGVGASARSRASCFSSAQSADGIV